MDYFSVLHDNDIFDDYAPEPKKYKIRPTAKGIVIDNDGSIALLSTRGHSLLPGGGVEKGESGEEAFVRECEEEIGCIVKVVANLGKARQYRAKDAICYDFEFFLATVIGGKGAPTTHNKSELALTLSWKSLEDTMRIFEDQLSAMPLFEYPSHFNARTQLVLLKMYQEINNR